MPRFKSYTDNYFIVFSILYKIYYTYIKEFIFIKGSPAGGTVTYYNSVNAIIINFSSAGGTVYSR